MPRLEEISDVKTLQQVASHLEMLRSSSMVVDDSTQLSLLLRASAAGDRKASDRVYGVLYDELRHLARAQLKRHVRGTLDTTEVVHEAYVKINSGAGHEVVDRNHFLRLAARAMRQVLVDHARQKLRQKRGGGARRKTLDDHHAVLDTHVEHVIAVDQALTRISRHDKRLPSVVECKYFAGYTEAETAAALDLSERTVRRLWQIARTELRTELTS